jgi:hypothetical protein
MIDKRKFTVVQNHRGVEGQDVLVAGCNRYLHQWEYMNIVFMTKVHSRATTCVIKEDMKMVDTTKDTCKNKVIY